MPWAPSTLVLLAAADPCGSRAAPLPAEPPPMRAAAPSEDDAAPTPEGASAPAVGFAGREIYRLSDTTFGLVSGDWNGDGIDDAAAVNRSRARVELLVRLPEDAGDWIPEEAATPDLNDLRYDGRFRRAFHGLDRRVWRLAAGDLDGDGIDELVYAEDAGRLSLIALTDEEGEPLPPEADARLVERRVFDALRKGTRFLGTADIDGDGRDDVLAAGEGELLLLRSPDEGGPALGDAETLDYPADGFAAAHVLDLDGDGRRDLLQVHHEHDHPFRIRLRQADGTFGPRSDLDLPPVRSHVLTDVDGDGAREVVCVLQVSGRIECLEPAESDDPVLLRHAFGRSGAGGRDDRTYAIGDLDGDGTGDLVVAAAEISRVRLLLGRAGHTSPRRVDAPSLASVAHPAVGDVDGDGAAELCIASAPERMIGVTRLVDGALPFPETRATEGEPAALDVADVDGDGFADAVVLATRGEGRRREYLLETWRGGPDGLAAAPEVVPVEGLEKVPAALAVADLSRDGRADYVLFPASSRDLPVVLFGTDEGPVRDERGEDAPGMGILEGAGRDRLQVDDVDGDGAAELLAATGSFARALWFEREAGERPRWQPRVLGQWSGPDTNAAVTGVCAADVDGDGEVEIVLRDETNHEALVLPARFGEPASAPREPVARFDVGRLGFRGLRAADLDGDGDEEVVVLGDAQFGAWFAGRPALALEHVAAYDGGESRVVFDRLAAAELDGSDGAEIVVTELVEHELRIVRLGEGRLGSLLGFRVFEEKTFASSSNTREPRELSSADFTGDGRADLAVLVHDNLILYPQQ